MADERRQPRYLVAVLAALGLLSISQAIKISQTGSPAPASQTTADARTLRAPKDDSAMDRDLQDLKPLVEYFSEGDSDHPKTAQDVLRTINCVYCDGGCVTPSLFCLVASLPNPVESVASARFDEYLDVLQRAIELQGYVLDRFSIPWKRAHDDALTIKIARTRDAGEVVVDLEQKEPKRPTSDRPGLMLFREAFPSRDDPHKTPSLVVVLLVPESPVSGLRKPAFWRALDLVDKYFHGCLRSEGSAKEPPRAPGRKVLHLVTPCFNGSQRSLETVIEGWAKGGAKKKGSYHFRVISGSPALLEAERLNGLFGKADAHCLTYRSMVHQAKVARQRMLEYLTESLDYKADQIAILVESNSGLAQAAIAKEPVDGRPSDFIFPLQVTETRKAYARQGLLQGSKLIASSSPERLDMPAEDETSPSDLPPSYTPSSTAALDEMALTQVLTAISHGMFRAVGIVATHPLDVVFLAHQVRRFCPNVRLFTIQSDLLLTRTEEAAYLRGMLVASTYPLYPSNQWVTPPYAEASHVFFSEQGSQALYNAIAAHLWEMSLVAGHRGPLLLEFGDPYEATPSAASRPPVWISVVGERGLFPIKYFSDRQHGAVPGITESLYDPASNPEERKVGTEPPDNQKKKKTTTPGMRSYKHPLFDLLLLSVYFACFSVAGFTLAYVRWAHSKKWIRDFGKLGTIFDRYLRFFNTEVADDDDADAMPDLWQANAVQTKEQMTTPDFVVVRHPDGAVRWDKLSQPTSDPQQRANRIVVTPLVASKSAKLNPVNIRLFGFSGETVIDKDLMPTVSRDLQFKLSGLKRVWNQLPRLLRRSEKLRTQIAQRIDAILSLAGSPFKSIEMKEFLWTCRDGETQPSGIRFISKDGHSTELPFDVERPEPWKWQVQGFSEVLKNKLKVLKLKMNLWALKRHDNQFQKLENRSKDLIRRKQELIKSAVSLIDTSDKTGDVQELIWTQRVGSQGENALRGTLLVTEQKTNIRIELFDSGGTRFHETNWNQRSIWPGKSERELVDEQLAALEKVKAEQLSETERLLSRKPHIISVLSLLDCEYEPNDRFGAAESIRYAPRVGAPVFVCIVNALTFVASHCAFIMCVGAAYPTLYTDRWLIGWLIFVIAAHSVSAASLLLALFSAAVWGFRRRGYKALSKIWRDWRLSSGLFLVFFVAIASLWLVWLVGIGRNWFPSPDWRLDYEHFVDPPNGVSPVFPTLFLIGAFGTWLYAQLARQRLYRFTYMPSKPFAKTRPGLSFQKVLQDLRRKREEVNEMMTRPMSALLRVHALVLVVVWLVGLMAAIRLNARGMPRSSEGFVFDCCFWGLFALMSVIIALDSLQMLGLWRTTRAVLRLAVALPMSQAFDRIPARFKYWFHDEEDFRTRKNLAVQQCKALQERSTKEIADIFYKLFPEDGEETWKTRYQDLKQRLDDQEATLDATREGVHQFLTKLWGALPIEDISRFARGGSVWDMKFAVWLNTWPLLPRHVRSEEVDDGDTEPAGPLTGRVPGKAADRAIAAEQAQVRTGEPDKITSTSSATVSNRELTLVRDWARTAEDLVALQVVRWFGPALAQFLPTMTFLVLGSICLLLAVSSYPFDQEGWLITVPVTLILLVGGVIFTVIIGINVDELISRVSDTTPGRLSWDSAFISQLMTTIVPLFAALLAVSLDFSDMLRTLFGPLLQLW